LALVLKQGKLCQLIRLIQL